MKVMTIAGTRPELIRLSVILKKLPTVAESSLVWTGQNHDPLLSTAFMDELDLHPNVHLGGGSFGDMCQAFDIAIKAYQPDKVLVLGDTYSGLLSVVASRYGIPVYHMEAGNRCFDDRVPEERNRRIIDAASTVNMPYTRNSYDNLIREGYHKNQVFAIGNPINEVMRYHFKGVVAHRGDPFVLATLHRADNVDNPHVAKGILAALGRLRMKVILSCHPRLASKEWFTPMMKGMPNVEVIKPVSFAEFQRLQTACYCTITDSGTVPEESALLGKPCIVTRHSTERQELVETGHTILAGTNEQAIVRAFSSLSSLHRNEERCPLPWGYELTDVADRVIQIMLR